MMRVSAWLSLAAVLGWTRPAAAQAAGGPGGLTVLFANVFPFVAMILVLYFIAIRPQQKRQAEMRKMLENLKKGDRVVTQAGIHGTVVGIDGDIAVLRVGENVKIEFSKSAIVGLVPEKK